MVQRYEQTRKLQWYKRGAAYGLRRLNGTFLLYKLFTDFHGYKIAAWTYDTSSLS